MKKIILIMTLISAISIKAIAGSDIAVVQGDKKFMKSANGNAFLEFVWDNATYANKMPLTEKYTNLEELKVVAWNGFVEEFNQRSKNVKVVKDNETAKYKFSMKVTNMDVYFKVMGFIPANATKVWGTLTITNLDTNETIAIVDVKEVDGGANPSPNGCFSDCFEELGKLMVKLK